MRIRSDSQLDHRQSVLRFGDALVGFQPGSSGGDEDDNVEFKRFSDVLGDKQVTHVDGIESAAQQPDP